MNRCKQNLQGQKLSQDLLKRDLRGSISGQSSLFRIFLLVCGFGLTIFVGLVSGLLSCIAALVPFYSEHPKNGIWLLMCIIVSLGVWIFDMKRHGLPSSLWKAILAGATISITATLALKNINFLTIALLIPFLFLCGSVLNFIVGSFSSSLYAVLLIPSQYKTIKKIQRILIITSSIGVSWLISANPAKSVIAPLYSVETRMLFGCLFGLVTAQLCLGVISRNGKPKKNFDFLRNWAISFSTLKSTSFCDLDLSGVDLTNAKLANTDFRARELYRTCLKGVTGLERARVDNRYLDLDRPKVQQLLTRGYSDETDFSRVNLQGAYLQDAMMQRFDLTEANLNGADLSGADLRDSILLRSQVTGVDFSRANLTGICIQDWSVNSETVFAGVQCDYVYREYRDNRPADRYPCDRNFKPGEFESLFQKLTNAVELVFQDQIDWRALSFTFEKFRIEDDGMGLELKGIEQRGDYWIVKVTHGEGVSKQLVEQQVHSTYDDLRALMEAKDKQINQLLGIVDHQTKAMQQQAEALTNFSQHPLGNNFFISGSTITNLAGSGQIEYREAADRVRSLVTDRVNPNSILQRLIGELNDQNVATTSTAQRELIQQVLLSEAEQDPAFRQFLLQQGQEIINSLPSEDIAIAVQAAIAQLRI